MKSNTVFFHSRRAYGTMVRELENSTCDEKDVIAQVASEQIPANEVLTEVYLGHEFAV